jgi:hypothetical protein
LQTLVLFHFHRLSPFLGADKLTVELIILSVAADRQAFYPPGDSVMSPGLKKIKTVMQ